MYTNAFVNSFHQSPFSGPITAACTYRSGFAWDSTHITAPPATSSIVAYGRSAAQRPAPRTAVARRGARVVVVDFGRANSDPNRARPRGAWVGACTRGSFGARLRRRLPQ